MFENTESARFEVMEEYLQEQTQKSIRSGSGTHLKIAA